ncbi:MAG: hypothetical protein PVF69_06425 [Gemmatimonadota bacterium]
MNWGAIGAVGEILGALAVLVTLVFLARQIRQTNQLGRAEAEREWFATWHGIVARLMGSAEAADLLRNGLDHYAALSPDDQAVLSTRLIAFFDHADILRRLNENGYVSDDIRDRVVGVCLGIIRTPGGAEWWARVAPFTMFHEYFDALPRDDAPPITDMMSYLSRPG